MVHLKQTMAGHGLFLMYHGKECHKLAFCPQNPIVINASVTALLYSRTYSFDLWYLVLLYCMGLTQLNL